MRKAFFTVAGDHKNCSSAEAQKSLLDTGLQVRWPQTRTLYLNTTKSRFFRS